MTYRITLISLLLFITTALHAQEHILGKQLKDAIIQLGTEYTRTQDGPVTKLIYAPITIDHPTIGKLTEYDQYDFLNDVCEARHSYIPLSYKQDFIDYLNTQFGCGHNLWRGDNNTYITIKTHDNNFELMTWTPTYEAFLDNR